VIESDHTLILGWSESIFTIVGELAIANESRRGASIVILADMDKVEMEDAIRVRVKDLRGTRVVCRTGDPISVVDLDLVNHHEARSVIVLAPEGADPDAMVVKTLLALTRGPSRREHPYHIVAEIRDASNLDAAHLAGGDEAVILDKSLTASRMIVQTSRQCGAAYVYQELLDFDGDEIYMRHDDSLTGKTYGDALLAYEKCAVIGLRHADGDVKLNPAPDTPIRSGDLVIAVAEDDSVLDVAGAAGARIDESAIRVGARKEEAPEATLILGFNLRTPLVIAELDEYARQGSRVELVAAEPPAPETLAASAGGLKRLALNVRAGNTTDRAFLESLGAERFDRVIVMCDADASDSQRADARVLIQLLHLRELARRTGATFTIVSEILDEADRELASVAEVDDIVVSDQVISYLLAQISENRDLAEVFTELLESDGSEVYMRPVDEYVSVGAEVNFATLIAAARQRGETAFGYRVADLAYDADAYFGVRVNPAKSETIRIAAGDRLIVLAED
jgi:voltage-gated potassium channel Kch